MINSMQAQYTIKIILFKIYFKEIVTIIFAFFSKFFFATLIANLEKSTQCLSLKFFEYFIYSGY